MGGGGGGQLSHTNPITPAEASADYTGAVGQAQAPGGVWAAPAVQGTGSFAAAPTVDAYFNPASGVQTGIPQGGFAAPAIAQYLSGTGAAPALSYQAGQHDNWLGNVESARQYNQNVLTRQTADLESGVPLPEGIPRQEGSFLRQDEFNELSARAAAGDQEAADTIYNNQRAATGSTSLTSGTYGGVGLGDRLHSGVEHVGEFSPIVGGVVSPIVDNARNAEANPHRSDDGGARSSFEIAIDRETNTYQDEVASGARPAFDMNDPSTWNTDTGAGGSDPDAGAQDDGGK